MKRSQKQMKFENRSYIMVILLKKTFADLHECKQSHKKTSYNNNPRGK